MSLLVIPSGPDDLFLESDARALLMRPSVHTSAARSGEERSGEEKEEASPRGAEGGE